MDALEILTLVCLVWLGALAAVLAVAATRAAELLARLLWLDTLALVLAAWLALVAYRRSSAEYLDAALVLGLLAFLGTVAAALYYRREELP